MTLIDMPGNLPGRHAVIGLSALAAFIVLVAVARRRYRRCRPAVTQRHGWISAMERGQNSMVSS